MGHPILARPLGRAQQIEVVCFFVSCGLFVLMVYFNRLQVIEYSNGQEGILQGDSEFRKACEQHRQTDICRATWLRVDGVLCGLPGCMGPSHHIALHPPSLCFHTCSDLARSRICATLFTPPLFWLAHSREDAADSSTLVPRVSSERESAQLGVCTAASLAKRLPSLSHQVMTRSARACCRFTSEAFHHGPPYRLSPIVDPLRPSATVA